MDSETRAERTAHYRYRFDTAEFDEARFELRVEGQVIDVQHRPLQVLAELLRHAGEVVTREELRNAVWDGRETVENVIDAAVSKIRRALGVANAARIQTEPRIGFRLVGPVERIAVGRQFTSRLSLEAGLRVPRRENFTLASRLGLSAHHEIWLARHAKTDEPRVYKFSADAEGLTALKREATLNRVLCSALGRRDDIVRLLDWNFESAPFYLECEFAGENLLEWGGLHLNGASLDARLDLCVQIAEAVAAAHSVGILHKDLKPANLLISQRGGELHIRIADFGAGRLLEPDRLTELGITQMGLTMTQGVSSDLDAATPMYVAPERLAGGAATVKSDVYALGILLYQLVVGDLRKPLVSGWERDVADELLREDISAATDGDPAVRLGTAVELAGRLRHLGGRRSDRLRQRAVQHQAELDRDALRRARARRPWLISTIVALALGLSMSVAFYWRANVERDLLKREAVQTAAVNSFLNDDLLRAADPTTPGAINNPRFRVVLANATRRLRSDLVDAPLVKASIYTTLGQTYTGLGDYANAESLLQEAVASAARAPAGAPVRARAEYALARVLLYLSHLPEARTMLARADRDAGAALKSPTSLAVMAHLVRGYLEDDSSHERRALAEFEAADEIRKVAAPSDLTLLFTTRQELIDGYIAARQFRAAKAAAQPLLAPDLAIDRVGVENWARVRESYAEILSNAHDYTGAIAIDQAAVNALRTRLGPQHFYVGYALSELANVYVDAGQPSQALEPMREAYRITSETLGTDSQDAALARANVGILEAQLGYSKAGLADISAARKGLVGIFGAHDPEVQEVDFYLASSLSQQGREKDAREIANSLSPAALSEAGEGGEDWGQRLQGLKGEILLREGHKAQAAALLEPAVSKIEADRLPVWIVGPLREALARARESGRARRMNRNRVAKVAKTL
jgi:eukaryotic-like serine/threonine-protein kinase